MDSNASVSDVEGAHGELVRVTYGSLVNSWRVKNEEGQTKLVEAKNYEIANIQWPADIKCLPFSLHLWLF